MQTHFPDPDAQLRCAVHDAHRGRPHHRRSWHRRHGAHRAGRAQGQLDASRSSGSSMPTKSRGRSSSRASRCSTRTRRRAVPARTSGCSFAAWVRDEVVRGQVIIAPGSVKSHTKAKAEMFVIPTKEGGRHTPIFPGYRPQFFFGTTDVTGALVDLQGVKMLNPGRSRQGVPRAAKARGDGARDAVRCPRGQQDRRRWGHPQRRVTRAELRLRPLRTSSNGRTPAFQAADAGSIPAVRSARADSLARGVVCNTTARGFDSLSALRPACSMDEPPSSKRSAPGSNPGRGTPHVRVV